jgi:hypothetical protein
MRIGQSARYESVSVAATGEADMRSAQLSNPLRDGVSGITSVLLANLANGEMPVDDDDDDGAVSDTEVQVSTANNVGGSRLFSRGCVVTVMARSVRRSASLARAVSFLRRGPALSFLRFVFGMLLSSVSVL